MISWQYAHRFGELPKGQAEIVEALVEIAKQLNRMAELEEAIQAQKETRETWKAKED